MNLFGFEPMQKQKQAYVDVFNAFCDNNIEKWWSILDVNWLYAIREDIENLMKNVIAKYIEKHGAGGICEILVFDNALEQLEEHENYYEDQDEDEEIYDIGKIEEELEDILYELALRNRKYFDEIMAFGRKDISLDNLQNIFISIFNCSSLRCGVMADYSPLKLFFSLKNLELSAIDSAVFENLYLAQNLEKLKIERVGFQSENADTFLVIKDILTNMILDTHIKSLYIGFDLIQSHANLGQKILDWAKKRFSGINVQVEAGQIGLFGGGKIGVSIEK